METINKVKEMKKIACLKCKYLSELYGKTPKSNRDYWLMTELFVFLHGSDECKESKK